MARADPLGSIDALPSGSRAAGCSAGDPPDMARDDMVRAVALAAAAHDRKRAANRPGPEGRRRAKGRLRAHERRSWIRQANGTYGSNGGRRRIKNHQVVIRGMMPVMARRLASVSAFSSVGGSAFFPRPPSRQRNGRDRSRPEASRLATEERRRGRMPVLGEPIACRYLRITAAFSLTNAYDNPTSRHDAAASTKKSLILAWRPGAQICATSIAAANVGCAIIVGSRNRSG